MKTIIYIFIGLLILIMGCQNPVQMETIVHEDGSLDKTIVMEEADSLIMDQNVFGISKSNGWNVTAEAMQSNKPEKKNTLVVTFKKSFGSAELINQELDQKSDTLFQIHSTFDKSFRWFYTYIRYSETFRPIDRLKMLEAEEYFNAEDKSFIDRLPGEGMAVSKADSFYLEQLNEKIFKYYANWGLFKEQFSILKEVVKNNTNDDRWLDTLEAHIDVIYYSIDEMKGDPFFASKLADSLQIPLPPKAQQDFKAKSRDLNARVDFMSFARNGKYQNSFQMPWTVVNSNADSANGNNLYWKPFATKFAIQEYEMYAESRKLNWWSIIVSVAILSLTIISFIKRRNYQS